MEVKPRSLALAGTKREEFREHLLVCNNAGEQRDQHDHRANADDADCDLARQVVQLPVHPVEGKAAACLAGLWQLRNIQKAARRVIVPCAFVVGAPTQPQCRRAMVGQLDHPVVSAGRLLPKVSIGDLDRL